MSGILHGSKGVSYFNVTTLQLPAARHDDGTNITADRARTHNAALITQLMRKGQNRSSDCVRTLFSPFCAYTPTQHSKQILGSIKRPVALLHAVCGARSCWESIRWDNIDLG